MKKYVLLTLVTLICISGCSALKEQALSSAAKDWCMTIRGSQIIPVYPLTTDIRPGDVLLVQTSIEDQVAEYKERGFLPINNLLTRLHNVNCCYDEFYTNKSCAESGAETIPTDWNATALWAKAPAAVFPTYTVEYGLGYGGSAAFPIQGIPVGIGLLGSNKGTYSVSIEKAYTYGLSDEIVAKAMYNWYVRDTKVRQLLADMVKQSNGKKLYLRVITRVFGTKKVKVQIMADKRNAFGADVAQTSPLAGIDLTAKDSVKNYRQNITALNNLINGKPEKSDGESEEKSEETSNKEAFDAGSGLASARIQYFTNSTIGLEEEFSVPVVIGYRAFDVQVLDGGTLAPPLSTLDVLGDKVQDYNGPSTTQRIIVLATLESIRTNEKKTKFINYMRDSGQLKNSVLKKLASNCSEGVNQSGEQCSEEEFIIQLSADLIDLLQSGDPEKVAHGNRIFSLVSLWQLKQEISGNFAHIATEGDCPCKQTGNNTKTNHTK